MAADKKMKISHSVSISVSAVFLVIFVGVLAWVLYCIHPGNQKSDVSFAGLIGNLTSSLSANASNMKGDVLNKYLSEENVIKKVYTISEDATSGPMPNPDCYGTIEYSEAYKVMDIIEDARSRRLLSEDEVIAFNPDADFYEVGSIEYYLDDTILTICWKEWINGRVVNCAEVKIADPSQFRRKVTGDTYGSSTLSYCSSLSKQANAVLGLNADFYAFRTIGVTCYNRTVYRFNEGSYGANKSYNCVDTLFINDKGEFVYFERGTETTKEELQKFVDENNLLFSVAFGPVLITNGEKTNNYSYPIGETYQEYSRAGIGMMDDLHYLFMNVQIVKTNMGIPRANLNEFADIWMTKGVKEAYNLDGGQTGEMYFNSHVFNYIDWGNERTVSDILYFATGIPETDW